MPQIGFIENKPVNWPRVKELLADSARVNHWTNFGPVAYALEDYLHGLLNLPDELKVVMTSSGTAALHAMTALFASSGQDHTWIVSSFGFKGTINGPLRKSSVIHDCDDTGMLEKHNGPHTNLIVTNLFGLHEDVNQYRHNDGSEQHLIVDAAAALEARHGPFEMISFHHTKPWGFGEGGCAIVPVAAVDKMRAIIHQGLWHDLPTDGRDFNGKMSDVAAAFILQRLEDSSKWIPSYKAQYNRILDLAASAQWLLLSDQRDRLSGHVPLLSPTGCARIPESSAVVMHKYYRPLAPTPVATALYQKIINFPCHPGVAGLSDDQILDSLKSAQA